MNLRRAFEIPALAATLILAASAQAQPTPPDRYAVKPVMEVASKAQFEFQGEVGKRIQRNIENWILPAPEANPAMLQILRDRDRSPRRDLVPWAGEFAGKYLISAVQAHRLTQNMELAEELGYYVMDLIATQDADGYYGPFPRDARMIGPGLWDLWGQYHIMLGLLLYHRDSGSPEALASARKCADYFCKYFMDEGRRVHQAGSEEMNQSSSHIFTLLYAETGEERYLKMAREIEKDWETPPSGDYVRTALEGKAFYQTPKPRWESLHAIQAIAELYFITGDEKYKKAYIQIWKSILEGDIHNTGGFSSGEQAKGNPYDPGAIETCCTIAWMAVTVDYLRMTGDPKAGDMLELALWNGVMGAQSPTGRWWTYNTPMDGERKASAHDIVFQARAGSPELNCCSVNAPRGLGMLADWAVMQAPHGIILNYYGPSRFKIISPTEGTIRIEQKTEYPFKDQVVILVTPEKAGDFELKLRIPAWSTNTYVLTPEDMIAGRTDGSKAEAGNYFSIKRSWVGGETYAITVTLDVAPRMVRGAREAEGKASIYCGPILMAYDGRMGIWPPNELPAIIANNLASSAKASPKAEYPAPLFAREFIAAGGAKVILTDFATAGMAGNPYRTWLPVE